MFTYLEFILFCTLIYFVKNIMLAEAEDVFMPIGKNIIFTWGKIKCKAKAKNKNNKVYNLQIINKHKTKDGPKVNETLNTKLQKGEVFEDTGDFFGKIPKKVLQ